MRPCQIVSVEPRDLRYPLAQGAGSDSIHRDPEYSFATTLLGTHCGVFGTGIALTLGSGNEIVCAAIELLGKELVGLEIEELMASFGSFAHRLADHPTLRWLGPHKGVVHLALASITNACFDLWAKTRGVPLWRLLLDMTPREVGNLLDLTYLEEVLTKDQVEGVLRDHQSTRGERHAVVKNGYPGYDTSIGWFQYEDSKIRELAQQAMDRGFHAFKLKVGSKDGHRDIRRAFMLRDAVGPDALVMLDANQQWNLPTAMTLCKSLSQIAPYFIEEPTHPDDIGAHRTLAEAIAPVPIALGEHVPNRVLFKNYMQAGAVHFVQADCTRVAGVSEFLTVSLLARKFGLPVVPHVGDMGQIHQHLVLFNHIALGHEALFLETIPHLREHFVHPARVENGTYVTPEVPGASADLRGISPTFNRRGSPGSQKSSAP
jgi:L-fuconate dehydratase